LFVSVVEHHIRLALHIKELLPLNEVLLRALDVLGVDFVSLQCVMLIPDHLTCNGLLGDQVADLVEVDSELTLFRLTLLSLKVSFDDALRQLMVVIDLLQILTP
jgi:hypothetical protein